MKHENKAYNELVSDLQEKEKELKESHLKLVLFNNKSVKDNLPLDTNSDIFKEYKRLKTENEELENELDEIVGELNPETKISKKEKTSSYLDNSVLVGNVLRSLPPNELILEVPKTKIDELKEKGELVIKEPCKQYNNSSTLFSDIINDIDINAIREGYDGDLGSFNSNLSDILKDTPLKDYKDEILNEVKSNLTLDLGKKEFTKFNVDVLGDIDTNSLKDLLDFNLEIPKLPDFTVPGTGAIVKVIMLALKEGLKSAKRGIMEQLKSKLVEQLVSNINKSKENLNKKIEPTTNKVTEKIKNTSNSISDKTDDIKNKIDKNISSVPKNASEIKSKSVTELKKLEKKLKNYC